MLQTMKFDLETVLTVTTGRLLTKPIDGGNGIEAVYAILGWMTNDEPFTHQLPRFCYECKPWLLEWFQELAKASEQLEKLDDMMTADKDDGCRRWIKLMCDEYGLQPQYDVPRIPSGDHQRKDAVEELIELRGTDKGIIVI